MDRLYKTARVSTPRFFNASGSMSISDTTIMIDDLPTTITARIKKIQPEIGDGTLQVMHDDRLIASTDNKSFDITITENKQQTISFVITPRT